MVSVRFTPDIFRVQRHGGVSRYIVELHRGLISGGHRSRILAGLHRNAYLAEASGVWGLDVDRLRPARARQGLTKVVDRSLEGGWEALGGRRTIVHKSYCEGRPPKRGGPPIAVTVHDMIHERFPGEAGTADRSAEWKRWWCEAADVIFTNSQHTKDDLLDRMRLDPAKVVVTPLGVTVADPVPVADPFGEPFVLFVGSRGPRYKNWVGLLEAIRVLGPAGRLACFGAPATAGERAEVQRLGLADRVRFVSGGDGELASFYGLASAFAYPSLHEGFGLPPLEAMAHGCPVVASRAGAIPETVGDAALLVPPGDAEALAGALARVLDDPTEADRLRRSGRRRAAGFTWAETTAATIAGYELVSA